MPRIDIVMQATGNHAWNMSTGWGEVLQREGMLNRTFRPFARWGDIEPENDDGLFDYLGKPESDIIILLGFDWHSQPLHRTSRWQDRWRKASIKKIAIINEMYSSEHIHQSQDWNELAQNALKSSISCVDAVICNHELDVDFLKKKESVIKPIAFQPFSIDPVYFNRERKFENRFPQAFFRGKIDKFYNIHPYDRREKIIGQLKLCEEVCLAEFQEELLLQDYLKDLKKYQILLNLPSISPTLTARTFEAMGCGGLLLQNRIEGKVSNQLFADLKHLVYYDSNNTDDLISKIKYLIKNPEIAEDIANQGYQICHEQHTISNRISEILQWVESDFKQDLSVSKDVKLSISENIVLQSIDTSMTSLDISDQIEKITSFSSLGKEDSKEGQIFPKIVIDGIFFQISKSSGISRVWRSLLEEWSNSNFAQHLIVLDRGGTAPRIKGIEYRNIELIDYPNFSRSGFDAQYLQFICDETKADLFISTYYTTPISTPSVVMIHDMIPEVIGENLSEPVWREKQYAILHAYKYITVSKNTARDLLHYYPHILPQNITTAYNGISSVFSTKSIIEINNFKAKFQISQPFFLFVGGRYCSGGYKNGILFFRAWNVFKDKKNIAIVCIGGSPQLEEELASLSKGTKVHILCGLSDNELKLAYEEAIALIYPSLCEGFGLPILEAMSCGCPVITCSNSSIPEVAGDAALYVDEYQIDPLLNALEEIQKPEVRQRLITLGLKQVNKFSWHNMAEIISKTLLETIKDFPLEQLKSQSLVWQELRKSQQQKQELENLYSLSKNRIQYLESYLSKETNQKTEQNTPMIEVLIESEGLSIEEKIKKVEIYLQQKSQELSETKSNLEAIKSSKFWKIYLFWVKVKTEFFPFLGVILGVVILFTNILAPKIFNLQYLINYHLISIGFFVLSFPLFLGILGYFSLIKANILRALRIILFIGAIGLIILGWIN